MVFKDGSRWIKPSSIYVLFLFVCLYFCNSFVHWFWAGLELGLTERIWQIQPMLVCAQPLTTQSASIFRCHVRSLIMKIPHGESTWKDNPEREPFRLEEERMWPRFPRIPGKPSDNLPHLLCAFNNMRNLSED